MEMQIKTFIGQDGKKLENDVNRFLEALKGTVHGLVIHAAIDPFALMFEYIFALAYTPAKREVKKVEKPKQEKKIEKVMKEFKKGDLHSGSKKGPVVKNKKQAVAIALSESRKAKSRKK